MNISSRCEGAHIQHITPSGTVSPRTIYIIVKKACYCRQTTQNWLSSSLHLEDTNRSFHLSYDQDMKLASQQIKSWSEEQAHYRSQAASTQELRQFELENMNRIGIISPLSSLYGRFFKLKQGVPREIVLLSALGFRDYEGDEIHDHGFTNQIRKRSSPLSSLYGEFVKLKQGVPRLDLIDEGNNTLLLYEYEAGVTYEQVIVDLKVDFTASTQTHKVKSGMTRGKIRTGVRGRDRKLMSSGKERVVSSTYSDLRLGPGIYPPVWPEKMSDTLESGMTKRVYAESIGVQIRRYSLEAPDSQCSQLFQRDDQSHLAPSWGGDLMFQDED
ncbi:hypothetical protein RND71_042382 [Anisodus tanguticus]|uniref:Uncharacterized protein n=1 Tax=Anisodus tanguticus TaxID=243964 RepID=A0AAE1QQJ5_9SOLA|nr:hypothetical protein RND71_042382 [Anisodus tanguticus]